MSSTLGSVSSTFALDPVQLSSLLEYFFAAPISSSEDDIETSGEPRYCKRFLYGLMGDVSGDRSYSEYYNDGSEEDLWDIISKMVDFCCVSF